MHYGQGVVFVLGAGFTKGFLPAAPLLEDDYGGTALLNDLQGDEFRYARGILEQELAMCGGTNINVERLMTRLDGRMPYDAEHRAERQLDLLLSAIKQRFVARISQALPSEAASPDGLQSFASYLIRNGANCITFNYDDLLDRALWEYWPTHGLTSAPRWSPDRGYGFPSRISESCVREAPRMDGPSSMVLLKLHGSLNWRVPLGYPKPYPLEVIRHHETWFAQAALPKLGLDSVEQVLEPDPVIIPPVLTKTALVEQPILRFLWSRAFDVLSTANHVVFIGYSLPTTDISAGYLFREGLRHLAHSKQITVVGYAQNDRDCIGKLNLLHSAYRKVFPGISEGQFDFSGARAWLFRNLPRWLCDSKGKRIAFMFCDHVFSAGGHYVGTSDGALVWGDSADGQSVYKGEIECERFVFNEATKDERKYRAYGPVASPGVPAMPTDRVGPFSLRPGYRDVVIS
jgi:SIR2-like domain